MHMILSYFDPHLGPRFHLKSHPYLAEYIKNFTVDLMDMNVDNGFFEYNYYSDEYDVYLSNFAFEIRSPWARGKIERLMLTFVIDPIQNPKVFRPILEKYAEIMQKSENLFKAFYKKKDKEDPEINVQIEKLQEIFENLIEESQELLAGSVLGEILVIGLGKVGKTSYLNALNQNIFNNNVRPTLGVQITKVVLESYRINAYDVGGQTKLRTIFQRVLHPPKGIIYMADVSFDVEKKVQAKELFQQIMIHYFGHENEKIDAKKLPVLIIGNKIDLKDDFKKEALVEYLGLDDYNIDFNVQTTSALKNVRVFSSFRWIVQKLIAIMEENQ